MQPKVEKALEIIQKSLAWSKDQAVLCSFGKDSVAMLHLVRRLKSDVPVIFFRLPYFQKKYLYANTMMALWDLTVHTPLPVASEFQYGTLGTSIMLHYQIGHSTIVMPVDAGPTDSTRQPLCGLRDLMQLPNPSNGAPFKFDLLFHGNKSCDVCPVGGRLEIGCDLNMDPRIASLAFPLRDWSDSDVFDYLESENVLIDEARYEKVDGVWLEKADKTANADYHPFCSSCFDESSEQFVECPKSGLRVANLAGLLPRSDIRKSINHYMGGA